MAVSLKLPLVVRDDADLVCVSKENPGYQFEREEDGTLTVSPSFSDGGAKSGKAHRQLDTYADTAGGRAFDSSAGFKIGRLDAVKSPNAAWISPARIAALSTSQRSGFWQTSPDVAIEIRSIGGTFRETIAKIEFYMENGTQYAVAIDPFTREIVERGDPPRAFPWISTVSLTRSMFLPRFRVARSLRDTPSAHRGRSFDSVCPNRLCEPSINSVGCSNSVPAGLEFDSTAIAGG